MRRRLRLKAIFWCIETAGHPNLISETTLIPGRLSAVCFMKDRNSSSLPDSSYQFRKGFRQIAADLAEGRLRWKQFDGMVFREFRKKRGITQSDLAFLLGVSKITVARWETGTLKPSLQAVMALAYISKFETDFYKPFVEAASVSSADDGGVPQNSDNDADRSEPFSPEDIKALRARLDISRRQLAKLIGVTTNAVDKWEAGDTHPSAAADKLLHHLRQNGLVSFMLTFHPNTGS